MVPIRISAGAAVRQTCVTAAAILCVAMSPVIVRGKDATSVANSVKSTSIRSAKRELRASIVDDADLRAYGLHVPAEIARRPTAEPLVVFIHGFNSTPHSHNGLLESLRKTNLVIGTFAYPNDHEVLASARLLSRELRSWQRRDPHRRIALVTHSMGGLVARACIEQPQLDPGNVERLIMIAPPSRGTLVAHLAMGTDIWEHWLKLGCASPWKRIKQSVVDGLDEAAEDLKPGSGLLKQLGRYDRNPGVEYTILLGTGGIMREREIDCVRRFLPTTRCPGWITGPAKKIDRLLAGMDEIVTGKGDGVVAIRRGTLPGVDDTVILPFRHLSVTGSADSSAIRRAHQEVVQRLVQFRDDAPSEQFGG